MSKKYIKRLKSFAWRLGGMTIVAVGGYILDLGNIWNIDWKYLSNFAVMVVLGLIVGELTKYFNPQK